MVYQLRIAIWMAVFAVWTVSAGAVEFELGGSYTSDGPNGNSRVFTGDDGITMLRATAWSLTGGGGTTLSSAFLGRYGAGLGVTNDEEGTGGNYSHTIGNNVMIGNNIVSDFVLLEFSAMVAPDELELRAYGSPPDTDISIWQGTFADPYNNPLSLSGLTVAGLAGFGFSFLEHNMGPVAWSRDAEFNTDESYGNALLIAATTDPNADDTIDRFKLKEVEVNVAVPEFGATLALLGIAFAGLVGLRTIIR